jgi:alanyl-tRNA synthetase
MLTGSEIRRKFLDFFVQKGHKEVHSSSLVPANDPTLLFTNAGMNQFKDVFLGLEKRDYNAGHYFAEMRARRRQAQRSGKCGLHQPPSHVFRDAGQFFSFGDYFKKDAIAYAWELITSPEWFGISKDKLYVTIFNGEGGLPRDGEAYDLWAAQGVPKDRIYEMGLKDNFWQMGDTGPAARAARSITTWEWPHRTRGILTVPVPAVTADDTSRFGIWCSCSSTGMHRENCIHCRSRRLIQAWGWSAPRRCCKA